ncbi:hypothetical protein ElyMa_005871300 [Elysia marginata]|uniref:Uncharacterized protein n=1 Tax=Elysia marginata TaxID=1093978 RepID=A0AAV4G261_9GAST|nr:hypothetical protein ElyMa_005871300 [Elysia marginata]
MPALTRANFLLQRRCRVGLSLMSQRFMHNIVIFNKPGVALVKGTESDDDGDDGYYDDDDDDDDDIYK